MICILFDNLTLENQSIMILITHHLLFKKINLAQLVSIHHLVWKGCEKRLYEIKWSMCMKCNLNFKNYKKDFKIVQKYLRVFDPYKILLFVGKIINFYESILTFFCSSELFSFLWIVHAWINLFTFLINCIDNFLYSQVMLLLIKDTSCTSYF